MKQPNISFTPTLSLYLRSAIFLIGQILVTLVLGPLMVLARPFPFELRYGLANRWVRFNLWVLKNICGLKYEVRGMENIPERNGVILCKHQSAWETIALQVIFPPLVFILKRELLRIPIWGWAMASQDPIAINRQAKSAAMKQVLRDGEARLKRGRWVVIFPEGTRMAPGQKGRYGSSGGVLAKRIGCPVVPVAHNAGEYWTKNGFFKHPGVIQVRIGPPLDSNPLTAHQIVQQAEQWIEGQMAEISGFGPYAQGLLTPEMATPS
jgi:1-acyl-sn-glycerol-3-phosphate acyltransferase